MADMTGILLSVISTLLQDWPERDVKRYFELAYKDVDMSLYVRTDSSLAAQTLAKGVSEMLVERMKVLRAREERMLRGGPNLLE